MDKWHLIQNQPLLRKIFKEPPFMSKLKKSLINTMDTQRESRSSVNPILTGRQSVQLMLCLMFPINVFRRHFDRVSRA